MKIDVCAVCGQYHDEESCESAYRTRKPKPSQSAFGKEEKFHNHERPEDKRKSFKRPPVDKMYRGSLDK